MKSASKKFLALAVSSIAFGFSSGVTAGNNWFPDLHDLDWSAVSDTYFKAAGNNLFSDKHGFGYPSSVTRLYANLTDTVSAATGRGVIMWTADSKRGKVRIDAGITIPVDSSYGISDSNTAVTTPVTMTITHGDVAYSCDFNIAGLYFKAPVAPGTTYPEYANYVLFVSQTNGVQDSKYFGSCSAFPTVLSAADTVSVSINGSTLTGTLK